MATSTVGASPGVVMSWSEMWTWNDETPASVPAGALISAGNSGRVARSLPNRALAEVKRSPVSCMPSPESPAKRRTMPSVVRTSWVRAEVSVTDAPLHPAVREQTARIVASVETHHLRPAGVTIAGIPFEATAFGPFICRFCATRIQATVTEASR